MTLWGLGLSSVAWAASSGSQFRERARVDSLREEVDRMEDSLSVFVRQNPRIAALFEDSSDALLEMDRTVLERVIERGSRAFLSQVQLHVRPDEPIVAAGDVDVGLGPLSMSVGSWAVSVDFQEISARLRLDSVDVAVADSNRLALHLRVWVEEAQGAARLRFTWDAAAVPGVLCQDFEVNEVVRGFVPPRSHTVDGYFTFVPVGGRLLADPQQLGRIRVRPRAPPEAWDWVRTVLDERDSVFECGLGLDPASVERDLKSLLERGFEFRLPDSVLRPIPLPATLAPSVDVNGDDIPLDARIVTLTLDSEGLRYGLRLVPGPSY